MLSFLRFAAAVALLLPLGSLAAGGKSVWRFQREIRFDTSPSGANVAGDVRNFPVAMALNGSNFDFSQAQTNGADVAFSSESNAETSPLPHEVEHWDAASKSALVWVKVPVIRGNSASQRIFMHWGNAGAPVAADSAKVFDTRDGFAGVWHLGDQATAPEGAYRDATANAAHASGVNNPGSSAEGQLGRALALEHAKGQWVKVDGEKRKLFDLTNRMTFSIWARARSYANKGDPAKRALPGYETMFAKGDNSWRLQKFGIRSWHKPPAELIEICVEQDPRGDLCVVGKTDMVTNQWFHFVGVHEHPQARLYVNGVLDKAETFNVPWKSGDHPVGIGNQSQFPQQGRSWDGLLDEARVLNVVKDEHWIKLDYESQREGQKFLALGEPTRAASAPAREHRVASAADILRLTPELVAGDVLVMAGGDWKGEAIVFKGNGTEERPITLRAETPGKVLLSGGSTLTIDGQHLVVSGLSFGEGQSDRSAIELRGRRCRVTQTAVVGGNYKFFVHVRGAENRVDHCYLAGKTSVHPTLQVEVEGQPNHHRIDHNFFGPRPPLRRNGGETIRVGYSHQSMTNSATIVEKNLFESCDGENEIISNKSCENIYRFNTFRDCGGMFTLRHGNRCRVEGNFFFGNGKRGSGGIRVIGEDHVVINNYIEGVEEGGFWITSGIPDSPLNGYFQARNCLIAFNTFVDSRGPAIELDAGLGRARRTLRPENITIANNLFWVKESSLLKGKEGANFKWIGNLAAPPGVEGPPPSGGASSVEPGVVTSAVTLRIVQPKLTRAHDGLWRPAADCPARQAAEGTLAAITNDIDGHPRTGRFDVGCDQTSEQPPFNRPLTPADVGPSWMNRNGRLTSAK